MTASVRVREEDLRLEAGRALVIVGRPVDPGELNALAYRLAKRHAPNGPMGIMMTLTQNALGKILDDLRHAAGNASLVLPGLDLGRGPHLDLLKAAVTRPGGPAVVAWGIVDRSVLLVDARRLRVARLERDGGLAELLP